MGTPRKKPKVIVEYASTISDRLDAVILGATQAPVPDVEANIAKLDRASADLKKILRTRADANRTPAG